MTAHDAPEHDGVRERHESMRDVPPLRANWTQTGWSQIPDRSDYEETS